MIKNNITAKLFVMLLFSFILFAMVIVFIQLFVVGRMFYTTTYTAIRENSLTSVMDTIDIEFHDDVIQTNNSQKFIALLQKHSTANKACFLVLDQDFNYKYVPDYAKNDLSTYYLERIQSVIKNKSSKSADGSNIRLTGTMGLPSKYIVAYKKRPPTQVYVPDEPVIGSGFMASSSTLSKIYPSVYIVAITAEANAPENINVLKSYIAYVLIFAIIISILLAAFFSVLITRRVVKIKNVASKMSELDFSQRCEVKSNDAIGILAQILNFLSEKLDKTLTELSHANEKLKSDLELQQEIDNNRKDFIAAVSHEFKSPLTLIRGYTEGMQSHLLGEENFENAQNIVVSEVDKMDRLVQELLDLSTLDSPNYKLSKSIFFIDELLCEIGSNYTVLIRNTGITLNVITNCEKVSVLADRFRIEQVIMNFLNNAMSNTAPGGSITLMSTMENNLVRVRIWNEGKAINEEDIDKIWEAFYRSDKSRSKKTGGHGLGLAICKSILDKHDATYGAMNREGGVEFYFTLLFLR